MKDKEHREEIQMNKTEPFKIKRQKKNEWNNLKISQSKLKKKAIIQKRRAFVAKERKEEKINWKGKCEEKT